ncbi:hypothetical protein ACA910_022321 [Epithemia clementina (nom. ined.)]
MHVIYRFSRDAGGAAHSFELLPLVTRTRKFVVVEKSRNLSPWPKHRINLHRPFPAGGLYHAGGFTFQRLYMSSPQPSLGHNDSGNSSNDSNLLSSTQSTTVKRIKNLLQKRKYRMETGQTVVEGPRMVLDLLRHKQTRHLIDTIVVDEEKAPEYLDEMVGYKTASSADQTFPYIKILHATRQVLLACSDTVTPQGIVAIVAIPSWKDIQPRTFDVAGGDSSGDTSKLSPIYLVLDGVSDPGNMGTLLRTAAATGVSAVFLLPKCCDVWNPKALRSAMTASFLVPTFSVQSWDEAVEELHQRGVRDIWAATMMTPITGDDDADAKHDKSSSNETAFGMARSTKTSNRSSLPHYRVNWCQGPSALVIGNEGSGLSSEIRDRLEHAQFVETTVGEAASTANVNLRAVHLPMNPGIESLNAAICGSVILFEYLRQQQEQKQPKHDKEL